MIGFFIGLASGVVQFWLLSKFTGAVTGGKLNNKTVLFVVAQFFLPFVVLLGCALLMSGSLLFTGAGMSASLIVCALVRFFLSLKKR